ERTEEDLKSVQALLACVRSFKELPEQARLMLCRNGQFRRYTADAVVVTEGSEGEEFYMLISGKAVVKKRGQEVGTLMEGDCFGEIALLKEGAKRTATVTIIEDATLFVVDKTSFLTVHSLRNRIGSDLHHQEETDIEIFETDLLVNSKQKSMSLSKRIELELENIFSMSAAHQLIFLFGSMAGIIITGGYLYSVIVYFTHASGWKEVNVTEGIWESFSYTLNAPGSNLQEAKGVRRFLGTTLFVAGLFSSSLMVGVVTEGIGGVMARIAGGHTQVLANNHTVVLGWSPHTVPLVEQLNAAAVQRAGYNREVICVLSLLEKGEAEDTLKEALHVKNDRKSKVYVRHGDPASNFAQQQVSVPDAKTLVIVQPTYRVGEGSLEMLENISLLTVLASRQSELYGKSEQQPRLVVETQSRNGRNVIKQAAGNNVVIVDAMEIISNHLVRCAFSDRGLHDVHQKLLKRIGVFSGELRESSEKFMMASCEGLHGKTWEEATTMLSKAIPVGVLPAATSTTIIAPSDDFIISEGDNLIVLARHDRDVKANPELLKEMERPTQLPASYHPDPVTPQNVVILGYNGSVPHIIQNMDNMDEEIAKGSTVTIIAEQSSELFQEECLENGVVMPMRNATLTLVNADPTKRASIEPHILAADQIIVLADESHSPCSAVDPLAQDSRTLAALLHIRDIVTDWGLPYPSIVAQVLKQLSHHLVHTANPRAEAVLTTDLVASTLAVATEDINVTNMWLQLLSNLYGYEIYLKPIERYTGLDTTPTFLEIQRRTALLNEVALGYRINSHVKLNPDRNTPIDFHHGDSIIVLAIDGTLDTNEPRENSTRGNK
ncbi:hypothetical protein CYMTET_52477, partial [Cymbomonas tetramitiformis]